MKKIILLVLSLMLCTIAGCGGGGGDDFFFNDGALNIYNDSNYYVEEVYLARSGTSDPWGPDQLDEHIHPDDDYTIYDIPDDRYDMRIVLDNGSVWIFHDIDIYDGLITYFDVPYNVNKTPAKTAGQPKAASTGGRSAYKPLSPSQEPQ